MSAIIRATKLAKKYSVRGRAPYVALRDEIGKHIRGLKTYCFGTDKETDCSGSASTKDFWALRDISFELHRGERLGIIGRNGAGKSTLLKLLTRVTYPTLGTLSIKGRVASLLEVGVGFHPDLTGRENIYLCALLLGVSRLEVRSIFDELVQFSGVEAFIDVPVKRYSSGMYVRLAFAVAVHLRADVVVLDEVLAVGDIAYQRKCVDKIESLCRSGTALILVSHNLRLLSQLCNRALLIQGGMLALQGAVAEVMQQYNESLRERLFAQAGRHNFPVMPEKSAQVLSISLTDLSGISRAVYGEGAALYVQFELELRRDFPTLVYALHVWTNDQLLVVASLDSDEENLAQASRDAFPRKKGKYSVRVVVPTHCLSPGIYEIELVITPGPNRVDTCRGIYFEVAGTQDITVHSMGNGDSAIVRAPLSWSLA